MRMPFSVNGISLAGQLSLNGVALLLMAVTLTATEYHFGTPNSSEQYLLELINRARKNPNAEAARQGISLNQGLPAGTISSQPKQPLAWHPALLEAARNHTQWMLDNNLVSHTGAGNSSAADRITAAGYPFGNGWWTYSENISLTFYQGSLQAKITAAHGDLVRSTSGHRQNIFKDRNQEIGISPKQGNYYYSGHNFDALYFTEDYAGSDSTPGPFLVGVVHYNDDGNNFYDIGEGVGGAEISVDGVVWTAVTGSSGGYSLPLPGNGTYTINCQLANGIEFVRQVTVTGELNQKVDFRTTSSQPTPTPTPRPTPTDELLGIDLNGDKYADLTFLNIATGELTAWYLDGQWLRGSETFSQFGGIAWQVVALADMDQDDNPDLIWQNSASGLITIWLQDGPRFVAERFITDPLDNVIQPAGLWIIAAVADLNSDGSADLVWQNKRNGRIAVWWLDGTTYIGGELFSNQPANANWRVIAAPDLDGDGDADLLWRNRSNGKLAGWKMNSTSFINGISIPAQGGKFWQVVAVQDMDGDGDLDFIWQNLSNSQAAVWFLNSDLTVDTTAWLGQQAPAPWQIRNQRPLD